MALKKYIQLRVESGDPSLDPEQPYYWECPVYDMTPFDCFEAFKRVAEPTLLTATPPGVRVNCLDLGTDGGNTTIPGTTLPGINDLKVTSVAMYFSGTQSFLRINGGSQSEGYVGPYTVEVRKASDNSLLHSQTNVTVMPYTTSTPITYNGEVKVTITSTSRGSVSLPYYFNTYPQGCDLQFSPNSLPQVVCSNNQNKLIFGVSTSFPNINPYIVKVRRVSDGGVLFQSTSGVNTPFEVPITYFGEVYIQVVSSNLINGSNWATPIFNLITTNKCSQTTSPTCTLSIVDVIQYQETGQEFLKAAKLAGMLSGTRNYNFKLKRTNGAVIKERDVNDIPDGYEYILFNVQGDGITENGTYLVEIFDKQAPSCVAQSTFNVTAFGSGNTTVPGTTTTTPVGPTTTRPQTTVPPIGGGGASFYMTDAQLYDNSYEPRTYFSLKDIPKEVTPFHSTKWLETTGLTLGKNLVTEFGFGVMDGIFRPDGSPLSEDEWHALVPRSKRYKEISQNGTTTVGHGYGEKITDPGAIGHGQQFSTIDGPVTVNLIRQGGEIDADYNFFLVTDLMAVNDQGASYFYDYIRWDAEHLPPSYAYRKQWLARRNSWEGGKYRTAANGGTNPTYMNMSDEQWIELLFDQIAKYGLRLMKPASDRIIASGGYPWLTCYGSFGDPGSDIFNRRVSINGEQYPTLRELQHIDHAVDFVYGYYVGMMCHASAEDNMKLHGIDYTRVPRNSGVKTGIATYWRLEQVNDLNSLRPQMRVRMEDENGNLVKDQNGVAFKLLLVYKTPTKMTSDHVVILRSENDQVPDLTFTLPEDVDLSWWKLHSNYNHVQDFSIGKLLKTAWRDRSPQGRYVVAQVYPYSVQYCCIMFGTCGDGGTGAGQCEGQSCSSASLQGQMATHWFRNSKRIKSVMWQADRGFQKATVGPAANYKTNYAKNAKQASFRVLEVFAGYQDLYQHSHNYYPLTFEINYGQGWVGHSQYLETLDNWDIDSPKAAIDVMWNETLGKGVIAGYPMYRNSLNVQIRYTIPGQGQVTKNLPLSKSYTDFFYVERI